MLTSDIWGDILRFVVRAVPRQHNNEKEIQKDLISFRMKIDKRL